MRPDDVSIGEDVPELLRGWETEAAGEVGFCEDTVCGGTAGLTNLSCDIRISERGIPVDKPCNQKSIVIRTKRPKEKSKFQTNRMRWRWRRSTDCMSASWASAHWAGRTKRISPSVHYRWRCSRHTHQTVSVVGQQTCTVEKYRKIVDILFE